MRFAFVDAKKAEHKITTLCRVLQVRRSGYYAWVEREEVDVSPDGSAHAPRRSDP